MGKDSRKLSDKEARLLTGYFNNTLTEQEHDELDEWVCASDENMIIFERLLEAGEDKTELDRMAELTVKYILHTITKKEKRKLDKWSNASAENQAMFQNMIHPDKVKEMMEGAYQRIQQQGREKNKN